MFSIKPSTSCVMTSSVLYSILLILFLYFQDTSQGQGSRHLKSRNRVEKQYRCQHCNKVLHLKTCKASFLHLPGLISFRNLPESTCASIMKGLTLERSCLTNAHNASKYAANIYLYINTFITMPFILEIQQKLEPQEARCGRSHARPSVLLPHLPKGDSTIVKNNSP